MANLLSHRTRRSSFISAKALHNCMLIILSLSPNAAAHVYTCRVYQQSAAANLDLVYCNTLIGIFCTLYNVYCWTACQRWGYNWDDCRAVLDDIMRLRLVLLIILFLFFLVHRTLYFLAHSTVTCNLARFTNIVQFALYCGSFYGRPLVHDCNCYSLRGYSSSTVFFEAWSGSLRLLGQRMSDTEDNKFFTQ